MLRRRVADPGSGTSRADSSSDLERRVQEIGRELLAATREVAGKRLWSERLINWALQNEAFKTQLFRFIDVFPVLKTPEAVHRHLVEYLEQPGVAGAGGVELPAGLSVGLKAGGIFKGTLAHTIASQIESMAATFIAGRNLEDALPAIEKQWRNNIAFSIDLLGEAVVSDAEAGVYRERYQKLIAELPGTIAGWPANGVLESDHLGAIPRANVSIKISALDGHVSPVAAEDSLARLMEALGPLLTLAGKNNVLINFDMEHHALKDLTIRLFKRCCERFDFPAGLALQAYLRSADEDARELIEWARANGRTVTVRLIKGAYWDYEVIHAELMNWAAPVWLRKGATDACFERLTELFLSRTPRQVGEAGVTLAIGTHNVRSIAAALAGMERHGLPGNAIEFQSLRGMADDLKGVLAGRGYRCREYVPVGEMIPGMAYLVRRLLENTSNESWLRADHAAGATAEELLARPVEGGEVAAASGRRHAGLSAEAFRNEPLRDFSEPAVRERFAAAVALASVPRVENDTTVERMNRAVEVAVGAFPRWRDVPQRERSEIIRRAAEMMQEERDALAGLIIKESRKTWAEADADVCEAIDFCGFYAAEAMALMVPRALSHLTGEANQEVHVPRGPTAVISPWNFPLSICTGMTVAALVTGNPVLLKPAEQTPAIAGRLCEILWRAGVPREVLQFLPGQGEVIGAGLVRHPEVRTIAFTGSKAVGLEILQGAATASAALPFVKRVIAEMGGKNALIVDASADLDEAVLAARHSAFSYAGQKCSACSRLILVDSIYEAFLGRLVESVKSMRVGDPADPATDVGPVIDEEAARKIWGYIEVGKREARLIYPDGASGMAGQGCLIGPHLFTEVSPTGRLATEEIFGPVLSVFRARDFEQALELANGSPYKLTGGVFSRTPSHLETARARFHVGNLYINRGITGALVSRQPFGGFGLSGIGAKAGGRWYLPQFADPRVVTESTMRRGFAPRVE